MNIDRNISQECRQKQRIHRSSKIKDTSSNPYFIPNSSIKPEWL